MSLEDSTKKWQTHFFYVRNLGGRGDAINLPLFMNERPDAKVNWGYTLKKPSHGSSQPAWR